MKSILLAVVLLFISVTPVLANALGMPDEITILGKKMVFQEQIGNEMIGYYVEGEDESNWTVMFTVTFKAGEQLNAISEAKAMAKKIDDDPVHRPLAPVAMMVNEAMKEALIGYVVNGKEKGSTEHTVMRYLKTPKGIVTYEVYYRVPDGTPDIARLQGKMTEAVMDPSLPMPDAAK